MRPLAVRLALPALALAVLHGALLHGVLSRSPLAIQTADFLRYWPVPEAGALVLTPYLSLVFARDSNLSRFERILWLPLLVVTLTGLSTFVRLLQAIWLYVLAHALAVWQPRPTSGRANAALVRSIVGIALLVLLATVFLNRPYLYPVGTLIGAHLARPDRYLANMMAYGAAYFALMAVYEVLVGATVRRDLDPEGERTDA